MVLGLGIAAWRPVLEPGPAVARDLRTRTPVKFRRVFYHSLPLLLRERRRVCVLYNLFAFVVLFLAGNLSNIYLPGTFTCLLHNVFLPPVTVRLPRRSQHPLRRVSMTRLVCSYDQTVGLLLVSSSPSPLSPEIVSKICFASLIPSSPLSATRKLNAWIDGEPTFSHLVLWVWIWFLVISKFVPNRSGRICRCLAR